METDAFPMVSVIMPTFNAIAFLDASLQSILCQSHADFELIVVDDGSSDATPSRIRAHQATDPRIRLVKQAHAGVAAALNHGCSLARGRFIARMDADDIALPHRLERQVCFLEKHPDIAVVGSALMLIDSTGARIGRRHYPARSHAIKRALLTGSNSLAHPAVLMRRDAFLASGGYDARFEGAEDYELWLRMLRLFRFANLPDALLRYRVHAASASEAGRLRQVLAVRVAHALNRRPPSPAGTIAPTIDWANLDELGLDDEDRTCLSMAVAAAAVRQMCSAPECLSDDVAEAVTALFGPLPPVPLVVAEVALAGVVSGGLRNAAATETMASLALALWHDRQPGRSAYWLGRVAATHPFGPLALPAMLVGVVRRRLLRAMNRPKSRFQSFEAQTDASPATQPLVSVILPVRNRVDCVARAIRSVFAQSYPHIELIVVDDGSSDGTQDVVRGFGERLRMIQQAPVGAYTARNRGVAAARGTLIAFIDSDDAWYVDKLARQVPLFACKEVGLVFGDVRHVRSPRDDAQSVGVTSFVEAPPPRQDAVAAFVYRNFVPTSTVVVRRDCLTEIGGFADVHLSADYLAWFRIALRHRLDRVEDCVADYTVHAAGISQNLRRSLDARLALFRDELAATTDPRLRRVLRRLLFNLSLSLLIALVRGHLPWGERWRATLALPLRFGGIATLLWLVDFLRFQALRAARRIASPPDRAGLQT